MTQTASLLDEMLENNGAEYVKPRVLRRLVERVRDALNALDGRIDRLIATLKDSDELLEKRLSAIEGAEVIRLTVLATAGDLPASAGVRQWFRVTGDPAVYVGNGAGLPLRKLTTQVV